MPSKKTLKEKLYFFVDEAGDATFYNQYGRLIVGEEGCSRILLLGFIKCENPAILRKSVLDLQREIVNDPYYRDIPSIRKTAIAFHAKNDVPEIRERFYKLIVTLDFKAEFIVARKKESIFRKKHLGKERLFYDDLIVKLFENKLHLAEENNIYFAVRGNRTRQQPLEEAIETAKINFESKLQRSIEGTINIMPQSPVGEPCLQIVDYMNWAVQRAFIRGEDRYFKFVEDKVTYLCDVYDTDKYPKNFYSRGNKFDITKMSPL